MNSASGGFYRGTPANADTQLDSTQATHPGFFVKLSRYKGISFTNRKYANGDPKNLKQRI